MRPLLDGDVLLYEIGFCGEYRDEEGEPQVREWEFVRELLDQRIAQICEAVFNTQPPTIYLNSSEKLVKQWNRIYPDRVLYHTPNFRIDLATKKGYKAQRKQEKPFHYNNIGAYLLANYDVKLAIGMESDDLMSIDQTKAASTGDTIICSRDKDLKQVPGMHYSWPCGKQQEFGPALIDELGSIEVVKGKIVGGGLKFFYSQVLTGDAVDNIPGLPKYGPVKAYTLLHDCRSERELFEVCQTAYMSVYGEGWKKEMLEQCQLLWMIRELDENQNPIMYQLMEIIERE